MLVLNEPVLFSQTVDLPRGGRVNSSEPSGQVHWLVGNKNQLEMEWSKVTPYVSKEVTPWGYFPESTSGRPTDLTCDSGWEGIRQANLQLVFTSFHFRLVCIAAVVLFYAI